MITAIESPLAFLEEQKEAVPRDAFEPSEVTLGLVPKILNPIDVILSVRFCGLSRLFLSYMTPS